LDPYCNEMDVLATLIYNPTQYSSLADYWLNLYPQIAMLLSYNDTYHDAYDYRSFYRRLALDSYNASLYTIRGLGEKAFFNFQQIGPDTYNFAEAFDFCGYDCSMMAIRFLQTGNVHASKYSYNIFNGSCGPIVDLSHW
jgi:hypothetical protein